MSAATERTLATDASLYIDALDEAIRSHLARRKEPGLDRETLERIGIAINHLLDRRAEFVRQTNLASTLCQQR